MGGDAGGIELAAGERGIDVLVLGEVDELHLPEPLLLEEPLGLGDLPLAVAEPGLDRDLERAGLGRGGLRGGGG